MGWCSGTEIFDAVCGALLSDKPKDTKAVLKTLIEALEGQDWDCQSDSDFWNHPTVIEAMRELRPNWFDDERQTDSEGGEI